MTEGTFSCEDCGEPMTEPRPCLMLFAPLDDEARLGSLNVYGYANVDRGGYHRVSSLCLKCQGLKREDAAKRYPLREPRR